MRSVNVQGNKERTVDLLASPTVAASLPGCFSCWQEESARQLRFRDV